MAYLADTDFFICEVEPRERTRWAKVGDFVIIVILGLIGTLIEFQVIAIDPNQQYIPGLTDLSNYNLAYPLLDSTISTVGLILLSFLPWLILFILATIALYIAHHDRKNFPWRECLANGSVMARMVLFSFAVTLLLTDVCKLLVGAPRPYFLTFYEEEQNDPDKFSRSDTVDARLAFPSGHSSLGFSQLFLLTIMWYKAWEFTQSVYHYNLCDCVRLHSADNPHSYYFAGFWWLLREVPVLGIVLVFLPTYVAIWCACSRITDYKHTAGDVVCGSLIGASVAYVSYLTFFNETYISFYYRLSRKIKQWVASQQDSKEQGRTDNDKNAAVSIGLSEDNGADE